MSIVFLLCLPQCLPQCSLSSDFQMLFDSPPPEFCDVIIEVDSVEIPVNKAILAARVPHFERLFASGMKETISGRIKIDDADADCVKQVVSFIYSGILPDDIEESPERYLPVAEKYACSVWMMKLLSNENVVQALIMADLYRCPDLKKFCCDKIKIWKADMSEEALNPLKAHPDLLVECIRMT